jgi:hypothetical protein
MPTATKATAFANSDAFLPQPRSAHCGADILTRRTDARFCSTACRKRAHRRHIIMEARTTSEQIADQLSGAGAWLDAPDTVAAEGTVGPPPKPPWTKPVIIDYLAVRRTKPVLAGRTKIRRAVQMASIIPGRVNLVMSQISLVVTKPVFCMHPSTAQAESQPHPVPDRRVRIGYAQGDRGASFDNPTGLS